MEKDTPPNIDTLFPKPEKRGRGRPAGSTRMVQGEYRHKMYPLRFNPSERKRWEKAAEKHDMKLAEFMRWAIDSKCR